MWRCRARNSAVLRESRAWLMASVGASPNSCSTCAWTSACWRASQARARSADARASRIRDEASRDAAIAWSDVKALEEQLRALEASYLASRQSRDVLIERFINSRGNLFDVVAAEDAYFETATAFIRTLAELDAARYVLLSRTGNLLESLAIDPARVGGQDE